MESKQTKSRILTRSLLIASCILVACSVIASDVTASLGDNGSRGNIAWHKDWYETIDFVESTRTTTQPRQFYVHTNGTTNVFILNATAFAEYIINDSLPATPDHVVNGEFMEQWTVSFLNTTYNLPLIEDPANYNQHVMLYLVLENIHPSNATVMFLIRLGYAPNDMFIRDVSVFVKLLAISAFAIVSLMLLWKSRSIRKHEQEAKRAETLRGFGIGYFFGFLTFFLGEFRVYYDAEVGGFMPKLFELKYDITNFPINYFDLFICTLLMLGSLTFVAMTYIVEKKVKGRRIPIVSYNQLVATGFIPLIFAIPSLFVFSILYLTVAILIAATQIIIVYVQVAAKSSGRLRMRAILILLGIMLPVVCFIIRLFIQNPFGNIFYIVIDSIDLFGIYCFYLGNIKFAEKQV